MATDNPARAEPRADCRCYADRRAKCRRHRLTRIIHERIDLGGGPTWQVERNPFPQGNVKAASRIHGKSQHD